MRQLLSKISDETARRIQSFSMASLLIYQADQQELLEVLKGANVQRQGGQPWQPHLGIKKQTQFKHHPLKDLLCHLQQSEVGELIDVGALANYLGEPQRNVRRWLGLLVGKRFIVHVRQVGDEFYRIK